MDRTDAASIMIEMIRLLNEVCFRRATGFDVDGIVSALGVPRTKDVGFSLSPSRF